MGRGKSRCRGQVRLFVHQSQLEAGVVIKKLANSIVASKGGGLAKEIQEKVESGVSLTV